MSSIEHILFVAGKLLLTTPTTSIHCIHDGLRIQAEPETQEWFLGLAVADGRLLPVSDLGMLLNKKPSHGRTIEVTQSLGIAGLRVDAIVGFSRVNPTRHKPGAKSGNDSAESNYKAVGSLIKDQAIVENGHLYRVIDFAEILQTTRFNSIGLSPA